MHPNYHYIIDTLRPLYDEQEAEAIAKELLTECFGLTTVSLYTDKDNNFTNEQQCLLTNILDRLLRHEPLQYILGETNFCGIRLRVTPDVLIPRPETAELVEWMIESQSGSSVRILDIGTGSGCIPIVLSKACPQAMIHAWDISPQAIALAEENAARHHCAIRFRLVDALSPTLPDESFDMIVSNPPYITQAEKDEMLPNVLDWEPHLALFAPKDDVLVFYRHIADYALRSLSQGGFLFFECNQYHASSIAQLLEQKGFSEVTLRKDLSGQDRMIKARRP